MADPTLRETITSVLDQAEKADGASPAPEGQTPSGTPAEGAAPVASPPVGSQKAEAVPEKPAETPPAASAEPGAGKPPVDGKSPAAGPKPPAPPEVKPTGLRPPESWKPQVKEHWKTLPPQVQAEIIRRERQVEGVMKDAAGNKQIAEGMNYLMNQYQDVFKGENTHPFQTIANLLNISRTLRGAPPPQRAQLMAQVIQQYEIDLSLLDQALAYNVKNAPQRNGENQFQQMMQRQLAPLYEQVRRLSAGQPQPQNDPQNAELQAQVDAFAANPENEYFEVLRDDVADILEGGARRGQKISLDEAYERAMLMNNDLAPLVAQKRLKAAAAAQNGPAAEAARRAGLSVTGAPGAGPAASNLDPSKSVRNAVELAFQQHSART